MSTRSRLPNGSELPSPGPGTADLAALGRDEAVALLFRVHHRRLVGLARLLVGDLTTAEDVVQDAFAATYRRWRWIRDKEAAVGYLDRAVVNAARSQLRRRRTQGATSAGWPVPTDSGPPAASPETEVVRSDERRRVVRCLADLPARQREVIVLRYYQDRTEAEIADVLGISRGSVKQHASRGLAALARRMGEQS